MIVSLPQGKLLEGLSEKCFGQAQLAEMQITIDAEQSNLFDVLAHVAYVLEPLTREEQIARAMMLPTTLWGQGASANDNPRRRRRGAA